MADEQDDSEKTEDPSESRIEEFRKRGEVAVSKELNSVLLLFACLLTLSLSAIYIFETMSNFLEWIFTLELEKIYTDKGLENIVKNSFATAGKCIAPVMLVALCIGVLTNAAQVGFMFSPEVLEIKPDRINPINGFKKIFSKKSIVEAIKGIFKFSIILSITYFVLSDHLSSFIGFLYTDIMTGFEIGKGIILKLMFSILLGLTVLAIADFAWEKFSYKQKLMMTKQQAKKDSKERDGNPEIKQRIRTVQREMAQKRMMEDVRSADVIVTNPTHISVALKYDPETMIAPEVVAKGSEHVAMRIREIAKENEIPLVENVPLARAMYKTVKVGEGVPRNLYKLVAEVLAFVFKMKRAKKALS